MGEGEVRMLAQMYALVGEMEGLKTRRDGMTADNIYQSSRGEYPLWRGSDFDDIASDIEGIAKKLRDEI